MPKLSEKETTREKPMLEQLADGLEINKHELDEAWVLQPDVFWRVADGLARAISARDAYKLELAEIIANLDAQLRGEAERAGAKITETAIARELDLAPKVIDARAQHQRLCHAADRWQALKESYQQRSYALKDLTSLHIANYYQNNSGGAGGEARDRVADKNRQGAGEVRRNR
jgi:hypothetical protein